MSISVVRERGSPSAGGSEAPGISLIFACTKTKARQHRHKSDAQEKFISPLKATTASQVSLCSLVFGVVLFVVGRPELPFERNNSHEGTLSFSRDPLYGIVWLHSLQRRTETNLAVICLFWFRCQSKTILRLCGLYPFCHLLNYSFCIDG